MDYDSGNVFAKILRKELPCDSVFENDDVLAFHTIDPKADVHILVIPKGDYISYNDFIQRSAPDKIVSFFKSIQEIAELLNISDSYRLITNHGKDSGQEVFHFHIHLVSGNINI